METIEQLLAENRELKAKLAKKTVVKISIEDIRLLQSLGMPRFYRFGKEIDPTPKQIAYWSKKIKRQMGDVDD